MTDVQKAMYRKLESSIKKLYRLYCSLKNQISEGFIGRFGLEDNSSTEERVFNSTNSFTKYFSSGDNQTVIEESPIEFEVEVSDETNSILQLTENTAKLGVYSDETNKAEISFLLIPDGEGGYTHTVNINGDRIFLLKSYEDTIYAPGSQPGAKVLTIDTNGRITISSFDADNIVLIDTAQTITGAKTFTSDVIANIIRPSVTSTHTLGTFTFRYLTVWSNGVSTSADLTFSRGPTNGIYFNSATTQSTSERVGGFLPNTSNFFLQNPGSVLFDTGDKLQVWGNIFTSGIISYGIINSNLNPSTSSVSLSARSFYSISLSRDTAGTVNIPAPPNNNPTKITIRLVQDGVGGRLITWNAALRFPGGVPPTLSSSANAVDIIEFTWFANYWSMTNFIPDLRVQ